MANSKDVLRTLHLLGFADIRKSILFMFVVYIAKE
jgi:hypothetical protein